MDGKTYIKNNGIFYLVVFLIAFGLKYYYSKADSDALLWILAPTAWWVRTLSGMEFVYEPEAGYVSHVFRFVIAPSCSGLQFMIISLVTLIVSFVHRMRTKRGRCAWFALSIGVSWLYTIFINGFRIAFSMYLPLVLRKRGFIDGWLTPDRLHTITGSAVYILSLLAMYRITEYVFGKRYLVPAKDADLRRTYPVRGYILPVFWYFFIVLGIPFLNSAFRNNGRGFIEYALLISVVCSVIVLLLCMTSMLLGWIRTS